jgi:hypothetical protein
MPSRLFIRVGACLVGLVVLLALIGPPLLYLWGLSNVDGRPQRPISMATSEEQSRLWQQAGGSGRVAIQVMNPFGFFGRFLGDSYVAPAGEAAACWIARAYLLEHRRGQSMAAWHASVAALTIWITRNWSAEEILTAASEAVSADPRAPLRVPRKQV